MAARGREQDQAIHAHRAENYQALYPCWYLNGIRVDPSAQRTGLGSALIDHMLARIDDDGLPAFLDTSAPDNLGYYERFGFRVTAESTLPNGTPLWGMTRQPGPREMQDN